MPWRMKVMIVSKGVPVGETPEPECFERGHVLLDKSPHDLYLHVHTLLECAVQVAGHQGLDVLVVVALLPFPDTAPHLQ